MGAPSNREQRIRGRQVESAAVSQVGIVHADPRPGASYTEV